MDQLEQPEHDDTAAQPADAPKRLGRRSAKESRETRRSLLNAAIVEFSEKGMNGARIDDIAERAGVTKGAIYTHFAGREDLLVQACRSAIRSLQVERFAAEFPDLSTFVEETARSLLAPEARPARLLISELYASAMRSEVIADLLAEWHAEFVAIIADRIPAGTTSPEAVAAAVNFLNVSLSHLEVYQSMDVGPDEILEIVKHYAEAQFGDL